MSFISYKNRIYYEEVALKDITSSHKLGSNTNKEKLIKINDRWQFEKYEVEKKLSYDPGIRGPKLFFLYLFLGPLVSLFLFFFKKDKSHALTALMIWLILPIFPIIFLINHSFLSPDESLYDWNKLKENIDQHGYNPEKFNAYIKCIKFKNGYRLLDGNHRMKILRDIYDENHKIIIEVYENRNKGKIKNQLEV